MLSYCVTLDSETNVVGQGTFEVTAPATPPPPRSHVDDHHHDRNHDDRAADDDDHGEADDHDGEGHHDDGQRHDLHRQGHDDHPQGDDTTIATTTTAAPRPRRPPPAEHDSADEDGAQVRDLVLDKPSVTPGGDVTATGEGAMPEPPSPSRSRASQVGETTVKSDGTFSTPIEVPDVDPGRLEVVAHCGPVITTPLDVVLASTVSNNSSVLVLAFFVIVLAALLWYGWTARRGL